MNARTSCHWAVTISLVGAAMAVVPPPAQSASSSGSVQSQAESSHHPQRARKPKGMNPAESPEPSQLPGQIAEPRDPKQIIEERLQRGQVEQPVAQGRISERLEQFYKDSAERSAGEPSIKRPNQ